MKSFLSDGLSVPELLSLVFTVIYLLVVGVLVRQLLAGALTADAIDFFEVLSWTMLTILFGWFGDRIAGSFGQLGRQRARALSTSWVDDDNQTGGDKNGD